MSKSTEQLKILVINGPNLNMLGKREPEIYGSETLEDVNIRLKKFGEKLNIKVTTFQSNHEGEIVTEIQNAMGKFDGFIINPAAYTHTSVAIRDAILLLDFPVIEVHLSNIYKREDFRHKSYISAVANGQIAGLGVQGYELAMTAIKNMMAS